MTKTMKISAPSLSELALLVAAEGVPSLTHYRIVKVRIMEELCPPGVSVVDMAGPWEAEFEVLNAKKENVMEITVDLIKYVRLLEKVRELQLEVEDLTREVENLEGKVDSMQQDRASLVREVNGLRDAR